MFSCILFSKIHDIFSPNKIRELVILGLSSSMEVTVQIQLKQLFYVFIVKHVIVKNVNKHVNKY